MPGDMTDIRRDPYYNDDADLLSARLSSSIGRAGPKSPSEALQPEQVPPPPTRSRAIRHPLVVFLNFVLTVVILALVAAGGSLFFVNMQFGAASDLDQARTIGIERGTNLSAIADQLQKANIIPGKWMFIAGVWLNQQQSNLKAGEYLIPAHASMRDVMDAMVSGKGILYAISIPEGLTSQQIVDRLLAEDILVGEISSVPEEGSLLPETYKFTRGDTRDNIINRMRRDRDRVLTEVWARRAPDLPISSPEELVVLASIVEKETALADERSRVAAVFINRLRLNMRLQSDPTVTYGLFQGKGKPPGFRLSRADLDSQTAYNTYVIDGLPPAPIANPGRASLEAVANPSRTRDLFFVADGSGGHAFAETYEDHLRNVARWREINANGAAAAAVAEAAGAAEDGTGGAAEVAPLALSPTEAEAAGAEDGPLQLAPPPRPAQ
jgi:peptidoglycan lytic transglycosylase G